MNSAYFADRRDKALKDMDVLLSHTDKAPITERTFLRSNVYAETVGRLSEIARMAIEELQKEEQKK